jgi:Phage tail tube protein
MAATLGYQAGIETNQTRISYVVESTWGVVPAGPPHFKAIRYMSDTLAETKTRQRPSEINITREASQAVTTQQTAGGTINYAMSYGVYDDFLMVALQQDWQAPQAINGVAGDIVLTVTTPGAGAVCVLSSATANKFLNVVQGSWIKLYGFLLGVNPAAPGVPQNNGWWYVLTKTDATHLTLAGPQRIYAATETPTGVLAHVRSSSMTNGTTFKSMFLQRMLSSTLWLVYPGAYVSRLTLSGSVGNFFTGAIDIVSKDEDDRTADSSSGVDLPAPAIVMDPVGGFVGAFWNGEPMVGSLDQMAITLENTSAAPEYALGNKLSVGILSGTFQASGSFRMYFNDFTNYNLFQAETAGALSFIIQGSTGNSYAFTFPNAVLMQKMNAGGPGQPVYAEMTFEANPAALGGTVIIDRLPNVTNTP